MIWLWLVPFIAACALAVVVWFVGGDIFEKTELRKRTAADAVRHLQVVNDRMSTSDSEET